MGRQFGVAHVDEHGQHLDIGGANGEDLPVEVLSLHLDALDETFDHGCRRIVEGVDPGEVDRASRRRRGSDKLRSPRS